MAQVKDVDRKRPRLHRAVTIRRTPGDRQRHENTVRRMRELFSEPEMAEMLNAALQAAAATAGTGEAYALPVAELSGDDPSRRREVRKLRARYDESRKHPREG